MNALSLAPPVLVLVLGFLTKRVLLSLGCGVFLAAFLAKDFSLIAAMEFGAREFWKTLELEVLFNPQTFWQSWNGFICIFLLSLGILITLVHHCGGAFAYERFIKKKLRSRKHVEASALLLSKCLCIDDYFSSLTVGSVMYSVTDAYRIARAKLAFLVDAMAAPLTILCPVSSWVAAIVGFLRENGVHSQVNSGTKIIGSPFFAYLQMIPYIFYSFIVIFGAWFIVFRSISFGLMGQHEKHALATGNVFNGKTGPNKEINQRDQFKEKDCALIDFLCPILVLVAGILLGILYSGKWSGLGGSFPLFVALREASAAQSLFIGGFSSLMITICFFIFRNKLHLRQLPSLFKQGIALMATPCLVLILAWTLGGILSNNLGTGSYLAHLLIGNIPEKFLPVMFFIASTLTSFAIGSSWGTAAIMFPICVELVIAVTVGDVPFLITDTKLLFPTLGAILSGCVAGDHISPISDTTIMSSTSTAMEHPVHVETQMTYAVPLICIAAFSYLCLGFFLDWGAVFAVILSLSIAAGTICIFFSYRNKRERTKVMAAEK